LLHKTILFLHKIIMRDLLHGLGNARLSNPTSSLKLLVLAGAFSLVGGSALAQGNRSTAQLDSLNKQVVKLTAANKIQEGMAAALQAEALAKKTVGVEHAAYADATTNLAELLATTGQFAKAEPLYLQSVAIRKKALGESHPDYALALVNLAQLYAATQRFAQAEPLYGQALGILKGAVGENHPSYATALGYKGEFLMVRARYAEALPVYQQVAAIRKELGGVNSSEYITAKLNLALLTSTMGHYAEAEAGFKEAIALLKDRQAERPLEYVRAMNNLGLLYLTTSRYAEAEPLFTVSRGLFKKLYGEKSAAYGIALSNLGNAYSHLGRFDEAEEPLKQASIILKQVYGAQHANYAVVLNNLGFVYKAQGRYAEAEPVYANTLAIWKQALGVKHPNYALTIDNLAQLYQVMGREADAEALLKQAVATRKEALGEQHASYGQSLHNLALSYRRAGRYSEAEPLMQQADAIVKKNFGEKHIDHANSLSNQGELATMMGQYAEAEPLFDKALQTIKEVVGEQHPYYAMTLNSKAVLYARTGRDAEPLFKEALAAQKKSLGEDHPNYAKALDNLALYYQEKGRYAEAQATNAQAVAVLKRHLRSTFGGLSEREKQQYAASLMASTEVSHATLASQVGARGVAPATTQVYDNLLFTKGLLLASTTGMQQRLLASNDTALIARFRQWQAAKRQVAAARALPLAQQKERKLDPEQLDLKANALEKELAAKTTAFQQNAGLPTATWQQVQKSLRKGEVAVELVRYRGQWAAVKDSVYYSAYVLTPKSKAPELVAVRNGNALEEKFLPGYRQLTHTPGTGARGAVVAVATGAPVDAPALYRAFWQPIAQALPPGTKTVYLSADGAYQQVNLATLQNPATGKYLLEELDVRLVGSTRELVQTAKKPAAPKTGEGVLVGAPAYRLAAPATPTLVASTRTDYSRSERWLAGGEVPPLPGTAQEIDELDGLLTAAHWPHRKLSGAAATEEAVRELRCPRVLHIATHGFFVPAAKAASSPSRDVATPETSPSTADPLLRSGLLLAGVSNFRDAAEKPNTEDGILTAYEASLLDLQGTELVVLSACETGLGQVQAGEGVYGLQRGFTVAGARSILMSLWKVDDAVTRELMAAFYKNWLGGNSKRGALLAAQQQIKQQHPEPYYWGAFVLVGE